MIRECKVLEINLTTGKVGCLMSGEGLRLLDAQLMGIHWKEKEDCFLVYLDGIQMLEWNEVERCWKRMPIERKRDVAKAVGWY